MWTGEADGAAGVLQAALDRLTDPERAVRREPEALAPVELLDRADEPQHALLHEVTEGQALPLVLPRDGHDESQVRVDHPLLGHQVTALDPLGQLDLLRGSEQRPATRLGEQLVQRVDGGVDRALGLVRDAAGLVSVVVDVGITSFFSDSDSRNSSSFSLRVQLLDPDCRRSSTPRFRGAPEARLPLRTAPGGPERAVLLGQPMQDTGFDPYPCVTSSHVGMTTPS
jgi:hypothetical protein